MSAKKFKGEFEIVTADATYKGRFGMIALAGIEEEFGKPVDELFATLQESKSLGTALSIITHGLQTYHPELTRAQVADIIDEIGVHKVSEVMAAGVKAAFPEAEPKGAAGDGTAHPTAAAAASDGTGQG